MFVRFENYSKVENTKVPTFRANMLWLATERIEGPVSWDHEVEFLQVERRYTDMLIEVLTVHFEKGNMRIRYLEGGPFGRRKTQDVKADAYFDLFCPQYKS